MDGLTCCKPPLGVGPLCHIKRPLRTQNEVGTFGIFTSFTGNSNFGSLRKIPPKIRVTKLKILSKGIRSFEILDIMPGPLLGNADGNKGRFSLIPEDAVL